MRKMFFFFIIVSSQVIMVKGCPRNKTKAKGKCRTAKQKDGDRHRALVLAGKAKPYSQHKNRRKGVTKSKSKTRRGIKWWCADSRKSQKTKNGKMTMCDLMKLRQSKMNAFWAQKKGLGFGTVLTRNFNGKQVFMDMPGLAPDPDRGVDIGSKAGIVSRGYNLKPLVHREDLTPPTNFTLGPPPKNPVAQEANVGCKPDPFIVDAMAYS